MSDDIKDCRVVYKGVVVDVKAEHIKQGLESLNSYTRTQRKQFLESVNNAIQTNLKKLKKNGLSIQERSDLCNDIGIWFCEQVRTGNHSKHFVQTQFQFEA